MKTNQIICGEATNVLSDVRSEGIDLVVTDPPYLVNYRDRSGRTLANDTNAEAVLSVYADMYRVLKPDSYCISFYGWTALDQFANAWTAAGFKIMGRIVWTKNYASRASHTQYQHEAAIVLVKGWPEKPDKPMSDVQPWEYTGNKAHPTEKAVSVIAPLIQSFSKPGEVVLDPFSGSGSTCVAAALNGRDYLGIELEERHCEHARRRIVGVENWQAEQRAA